MSTAKKILSNTFYQVFGKLLTAAISVVIVKIITNYMDVSGYGQYSQVYVFLSYFAIASDLGLFTIAVREMSKDEKKIPYIIGNILTIRLILAIFVLSVASICVFFIPEYANTQVMWGVAISSIGIFFTILQGTICSVLQQHLKMGISAISLVAGKIATFLYILYVVYVKLPNDPVSGFNQLMWAGVVGAIVMYIITDIYVRKLTPLKFQFDINFIKNVVIKSLPYGIALILNNIYFRINSLFIFHIRGAYESGLYDVAFKTLEILSTIGLFFMNSVLGGLTKNLKENIARAKQIIQYSFDFLVMVGAPMVTGIFVLAYPVIRLISKEDYLTHIIGGEKIYGSDMALKILAIATFFQFLVMLFSFLLIALHHQNQLLWINMIGVFFNVLASYFTVVNYGFIGASFASVFAEILIMILMFRTAKSKFSFNINLTRFLKIWLSALVMGIAVHFAEFPLAETWNLKNKAVLILVPLGCLVYCGFLLLTKAITKEMMNEILRKEPKPALVEGAEEEESKLS